MTQRTRLCTLLCAAAEEEAPRDDDVLPESLFDAIDCAAKATANAFGNGTQRCISEILVEGFWDTISGPVFADDGDTERWWELNRRYIEGLIAEVLQCAVTIYHLRTSFSRAWSPSFFLE